jgi:hypothetical protein
LLIVVDNIGLKAIVAIYATGKMFHMDNQYNLPTTLVAKKRSNMLVLCSQDGTQ